MRYQEFRSDLEEQKIDEIKALMNMANWFSQKYHDIISSGAQRLGQGEIQKFTNQHLRAFMQMMGRYKVDWPNVTMYVIYQYLRLIMKLDDQDIVDVVNTVAKDPKVRYKKIVTIKQIKDQDRNILPSSFSTIAGDPVKTNQLVAQMIIAAGAVRQMERHWEHQAGAAPAAARNYSTSGSRSSAPPPASQPPPGTQQASSAPSPAPQGNQQTQLSTITSALSQLGATP